MFWCVRHSYEQFGCLLFALDGSKDGNGDGAPVLFPRTCMLVEGELAFVLANSSLQVRTNTALALNMCNCEQLQRVSL